MIIKIPIYILVIFIIFLSACTSKPTPCPQVVVVKPDITLIEKDCPENKRNVKPYKNKKSISSKPEKLEKSQEPDTDQLLLRP